MGLSGFGDLVLTCTSDQSRNFRFGSAAGPRAATLTLRMTVEGAATAQAVLPGWHARLAIDMPVTAMVAPAHDRRRSTVADAIQALMSRPLKEE
ncbi:MAG: NAD(P)H-dependent glycerol-3-phosphate dehydrogenase [Gemmobacter sp.]|nr:NAD(P)H-dependent glycerol-3-phosphate dehydrogenase [Gemmobacter sp.]